MRNRAIKQINSGKRKKDVAIMYGVNPNTITSWVKKYNKEGVKGLIDNKRGVIKYFNHKDIKYAA